MTLRSGTVGLAVGVLVATPAIGDAKLPQAGTARLVLRDAAPSAEALIARFLEALTAGDRAALRRLRVTEDEYRTIFLPGSVAPGAPLRTYPEAAFAFFWGQMNTKSLYGEAALVNQFGGRRYSVKKVHYLEGTQRYATFSAFKQLRLTLADESGAEAELATGSVVEVGGRYKFMSFIRD